MSRVEFETDQYQPQNLYESSSSKMIEWMIKIGIVNDEDQANKILLGILFIFIFLIFLIFFISKSPESDIKFDPDELIELEQRGI